MTLKTDHEVTNSRLLTVHQFKIGYRKKYMPSWKNVFTILAKRTRQLERKLIRLSSFFSPFSVVRRTQIFGIFKKRNEVVKPFFTWNNSFNLNKEKKQEHFFQYIMHFVNPNMSTLSCKVILGYPGLLFRDFLCFFFRFSFPVLPTDPISGNAFDAKRKKKGMA